MSQSVILLLGALALFALVYVIGWAIYAKRAAVEPSPPEAKPSGTNLLHVVTGLVTNFFDALGIGSFATTTAIFRFFKSVPDRVIPGTLNVGHTLPTVAQAFIFVALIQVDMTTLVAMIAAAVVGAWLGAGVISKWPRRRVQWGMGIALFVAASIFAAQNLGLMPSGTTGSFALTGTRLYLGLAGNFLLGALMTLGIGLYAPCMILVALLGMNPTAAFPIMMGSCAFLMPVASLRFIKEKSYAFKAALGLAIGGIPGSIIAGVFVKSLDLRTVKWLVVVVVLYAAVTLLESAMRKDAERMDARVRFGFAGLILGGLVGFLTRPAVPLLGQLPFETVMSRGTSLSGMDQILVPVAQESFNHLVLFAVGGLIVGVGFAWSRHIQGASHAGTPLGNEAIKQMAGAGLSDDLIVQKIRTSRTAFDVSPDALRDLKAAGLSDRVVSAMIDHSARM